MPLSAEFSVDGNSDVEAIEVAYGATVTLAALSQEFNRIEWSVTSTSKSDMVAPTITRAGTPNGVTATFPQVADPGDGLGRSIVVKCTQYDSQGNAAVAYRVIGTVNSQGHVPFCADEWNYRNATHGWTELMNLVLNASGGGGGVTDHGGLTGLTDSNDHLWAELVARPLSSYSGAASAAVLADARQHITTSHGSANTFTIPPNASVAFATGTLLYGTNIGAGAMTLTAGAGVTLNGSVTVAQHGWWWAKKTNTNTGKTFVGAAAAAAAGGITGIPMTFFASTVDGDPGAGGLRLNHATPASATQLYVDDVEAGDGTNIRDLISALGNVIGAQVRLQSKSADENWIVYRVGGYTSATGYGKLTGLTVVDSSATVTLSTTAGDTILSIDIGVPKDLGNQGLTNVRGIGYNGEIGTTGATPAVDFTTGDLQKTTLSANATPVFTPPAAGIGWVQWHVVQGAGSYTITFPVSVLGTPAQPSTVNGSHNFYSFFWDGTNYHCGGVADGSVTGPKLSAAPAIGAQLLWDGTRWLHVGSLTGTLLADASVTLQFSTASQAVWPTTIDTAAGRNLTLGTTGLAGGPMAGQGAVYTIMFLRASYTNAIAVKNNAAATIFTLPAALGKPVVARFYYDTVAADWALAGWDYLTVAAAA
jgi:hypothetical protein